MKLAYVSPFPPTPTGIADYSAALAPELAHRADIDFFGKGSPSRLVKLRSETEFMRLVHKYDLPIYQMGNSPHHESVYYWIQSDPGIVVLHDGTLHHFFIDRTLHRGYGSYLREMAYAHGEEGYKTAWLVIRGAGVYPFYRFPLLRRVVDSALGVIVHSETVRRAVLDARPDVSVHVMQHFAFPPAPPKWARAEMLKRLRLPGDALIIAS